MECGVNGVLGKGERAFRANIEVHVPQLDVVGRTCHQTKSPISQIPLKKVHL
jgi:hypothetical protein